MLETVRALNNGLARIFEFITRGFYKVVPAGGLERVDKEEYHHLLESITKI